jgi:hypothetical protein
MPGIFGGDCPSCPTKDQFIQFLQKQNADLVAKMAELLSPGVTARQNYVQPKREEKPGPKATHSPSRIAAMRQDKPTPPEDIAPALRVSEADFERH